MKTAILIACILANGQHHHPRGHYRNFEQCAAQAERFEREIMPKSGKKNTVCWCYKGPAPAPLPEYEGRPEDRKAPLP